MLVAARLLAALLLPLAPAWGGAHGLFGDAESGTDAENDCVPGLRPHLSMFLHEETYGDFFVKGDNGALVPDDRSDHYDLELSAPTLLKLTMKPSPGVEARAPAPNFDLELLGQDCNLLAKSVRPGTQEDRIEIALGAGLYVVHVFVAEDFPLDGSGRQNLCDPLCEFGFGYRAFPHT